MAREKFIETIATITDTHDDGTRVYSRVERGGIRDTGYKLVAHLRGGSKERPERLLALWARGKPIRIFGHNRHDGATAVTLHCPLSFVRELADCRFVERIDQIEKPAHSASSARFSR